MRYLRLLALLPIAAVLGGCNFVVMAPAGDIAARQRDLILISTGLMLLIIIPVMIVTVLFAWRYRQANKSARYEPDWDHSTHLELVIWAAPLLIIICLGAITWMGTHLLDPYRKLDRIAAGRPVTAETKPLDVQVVALDWKWLFIYPEYGIATVNELAAPVDRPIQFRITSSGVMNSFYIPALAGQIYAMAGMQTRMHAVINYPGDYIGFSANYSGAGFSNMRFGFKGLDQAGFDAWVEENRKTGSRLDRAAYLELERPTEKVPVKRYAEVEPQLFSMVLNMCVEPGKMCMSEMMAIDARGGLGLAGIANTLPLAHDKYARRGTALGPMPSYVASVCTIGEAVAMTKPARERRLVDPSPVRGIGLASPSISPRLPSALGQIFGQRQPSNT